MNDLRTILDRMSGDCEHDSDEELKALREKRAEKAKVGAENQKKFEMALAGDIDRVQSFYGAIDYTFVSIGGYLLQNTQSDNPEAIEVAEKLSELKAAFKKHHKIHDAIKDPSQAGKPGWAGPRQYLTFKDADGDSY